MLELYGVTGFLFNHGAHLLFSRVSLSRLGVQVYLTTTPAAPSRSPTAIATGMVRVITRMTFISLRPFLLTSADAGWVSRP